MLRFRAPALPLPRELYDRQQMDELVRALRIYFNYLDSTTPLQNDAYYGNFFIGGTTPAITAAGATQATATGLVTSINNVTVVAAGANGVRLPTAEPGMQILVRNSDASDSLNIYPETGGQINALGANAAYALSAGSTVQLFATTTTQWYTF